MTPRTLALVALTSILALVAYVAGARMRMKWQEMGAAEALEAVVSAQRAFPAAGGHGGYATTLESLTTPCPGAKQAASSSASLGARGYVITVRARAGQSAGALDCHGRPTARDFVASAAPVRTGIDGLRAMSTSAAGRIFVFFDGVPPREADMATGGLAMPLDDLRPIP